MNELKELMIKNNLNAVDIAVAFGVTKGAVEHWILGRREVPGPALKLIKLLMTYPQLINYVKEI